MGSMIQKGDRFCDAIKPWHRGLMESTWISLTETLDHAPTLQPLVAYSLAIMELFLPLSPVHRHIYTQGRAQRTCSVLLTASGKKRTNLTHLLNFTFTHKTLLCWFLNCSLDWVSHVSFKPLGWLVTRETRNQKLIICSVKSELKTTARQPLLREVPL